MAVVDISESILQDTADAIREMTGEEGGIKPVDFPEMILSIETGPAVESIAINDKTKVAFQPGETADYSVTISPEYAKQEYSVSSSDTSVATVAKNQDGGFTITAVENESMTEEDEFTATITVTAGKRDPKTDTLTITVKLVTIQPVDPTQIVDLDNLSKIAQSDNPNQYLTVGTQYKIPRSGNNFVLYRYCGVVTKSVRENGASVEKSGLWMERIYTSSADSAWGASGSTKYSASTLHSYIQNTMKAQETADFLACLADTEVKTYSRDGTTDTVVAKLFAPSMQELGITDTSYNNAQQQAVEGPTPAYYVGADNTKRVKQAENATTAAQYYWTRSLYPGASSNFGLVFTSGAPGGSSYGNTRRVAVACIFIGHP